MNKYYEIRGDVYRLEEDGRLVDPMNECFFRPDQVEDVLSSKASYEVEDIQAWCERRAAILRDRISDLKEYLQYADGPAYYQDKKRIRDNQEYLERIERYLEENF